MIVWEIVLFVYAIALCYYYEEFKNKFYIFSVVIFCIYFTFFFWPFRGLFRNIRICLLITLVKAMLPFTSKGVKFKDFLLADIMTSFIDPLENLAAAFCLFYCAPCREENIKLGCQRNFFVPVATTFPIILRIMQCSNKIYYRTGTKIQIINLFKYITFGVFIIIHWAYPKGLVHIYTFLTVASISHIYLLFFDLRFDWNILHCKSKNFLLRDKLMFPKSFYYFAIVTDSLFRFFWPLQLLIVKLDDDWLILISSFVQVYRRAQWCLFRLENEQLYNLEEYRSYLPVPKLKLDY